MTTHERYSRQQDIISADRLAVCHITVVGVGAIGRQVALQLSAMGVNWLQLVDFDTVEESNLCSQGFLEEDFAKPKVEAVSEFCRRLNSRLQVFPLCQRFRRSMSTGPIVFCCVDRIETRRQIWETVRNRTEFFCDGRMAAEVLRVLTVCDSAGREQYPSTLFASQEAFAGSCTAKATIYCANVAAGVMLAQFAKWLRRLPVEFDCQLNLLSAELTVS